MRRRMLMNFPGSFKSKSLRISQPIFDFTKKEFEKSGCWTQGGPKLKWHHFDRCIRMKTNVLCDSPVAQR